MPIAPKRYAATLRRTEDRPSAYRRGYNPEWQEQSRAFRRRYPLCVGCDPTEENRISELHPGTPLLDALQQEALDMQHATNCDGFAEHVDHLIAVRGGQADPLFWDESNWRGRSAECHAVKTRRFDRWVSGQLF